MIAENGARPLTGARTLNKEQLIDNLDENMVRYESEHSDETERMLRDWPL